MNAFMKPGSIKGPVYYLKSFAKINLSMNVIGKNENGYHNVHSLFVYIDLFDRIRIRQYEGDCPNFSTTGPFSSNLKNDFESMDSNLIIKALAKMHEKFGTPTNFDILLDKRVPVTSGMGGGSTNAATIIRFLNSFFDLKMSQDDLEEIALSIGSDVSFFLQNSAAVCEGTGNIVKPVDIEPMFGVIVCRGIKASTRVIYSTLSKQNNGQYTKPAINCNQDNKPITQEEVVQIVKKNGNDLLSPACFYSEDISRTLDFLQNHNSTVASGMSGAGPTCFAICATKNDSETLFFDLHNKFSGSFIREVNFLPRVDFESVSPTLDPYYDFFGQVEAFC